MWRLRNLWLPRRDPSTPSTQLFYFYLFKFTILICKKINISNRGWMDKHGYVPGETALSTIKINNSSVKPNKFVRMSVTKHLDLQVHIIYFYKYFICYIFIFVV